MSIIERRLFWGQRIKFIDNFVPVNYFMDKRFDQVTLLKRGRYDGEKNGEKTENQARRRRRG